MHCSPQYWIGHSRVNYESDETTPNKSTAASAGPLALVCCVYGGADSDHSAAAVTLPKHGSPDCSDRRPLGFGLLSPKRPQGRCQVHEGVVRVFQQTLRRPE